MNYRIIEEWSHSFYLDSASCVFVVFITACAVTSAYLPRNARLDSCAIFNESNGHVCSLHSHILLIWAQFPKPGRSGVLNVELYSVLKKKAKRSKLHWDSSLAFKVIVGEDF